MTSHQDPTRMFNGFIGYMQKVFAIGRLVLGLSGKRLGKQKYDEVATTAILASLACGISSLNGISKDFENHNDQTLSRSVLEDFLKIEELPYTLRKYIKSMIKKMKRGKMIQLDHVMGKIIASVDGVEIHRKRYSPSMFLEAVRTGKVCKLCQVAVHRDKKTKEVTGYETYHRLVLICVITNRGPMPLSWAFQESDAGSRYAAWLEAGAENVQRPDQKSEEKIKQQGELTVLKRLLNELEDKGRLPFDVLIGDGLYDKATVIDSVERYGCALIAVHKNTSRTLHQQAEEDFTTRKPYMKWSDNGKDYEGWFQSYEDHNRKDSQKVKIVRVIRKQLGKETVDNYFYCSDRKWMKPRLVEWCRHYRWKEENGFNAWTNQWELLKHMFHHDATACDSILGFIQELFQTPLRGISRIGRYLRAGSIIHEGRSRRSTTLTSSRLFLINRYLFSTGNRYV